MKIMTKITESNPAHQALWEAANLAKQERQKTREDVPVSTKGIDLSALEKFSEESIYLFGAKLRFAKLKEANLLGADLRNAKLYRADVSKGKLGDANLKEADLRCTDLRDANLHNANLFQANLDESYLVHAYLVRANLGETNLSGAKMQEANLSWANLQGADLEEANLANANLLEANLQKTNLRGTNLYKANVTRAALPLETFFQADYWKKTVNLSDASFYFEGQKVTGLIFDNKNNVTIQPKQKDESMTGSFKESGSNETTTHITDISNEGLQEFGLSEDLLAQISQANNVSLPVGGGSGPRTYKP